MRLCTRGWPGAARGQAARRGAILALAIQKHANCDNFVDCTFYQHFARLPGPAMAFTCMPTHASRSMHWWLSAHPAPLASYAALPPSATSCCHHEPASFSKQQPEPHSPFPFPSSSRHSNGDARPLIPHCAACGAARCTPRVRAAPRVHARPHKQQPPRPRRIPCHGRAGGLHGGQALIG